MKRRYKKLLSVLGAISLAAPFVGCEVDAEETAAAATNSATASASVSISDTAKADAAGTNTTAAAEATGDVAEANAGTNTLAAGGTNITNQQTTIIQRIPPTIPADVTLSKGVQEVVKLLQSGVS